MDQKERWQALQSHLTAARALVDAGDRTKALEAIDAALAIDPDFLAAHSLKDRILAAAASDSPRPLASGDSYAKFEARARRRRVDRRLEAARTAIEQRRLREAAAALDEIVELDPNLPELSALTASFDELRRENAASHRGPWIAAAATFAVTMFGATWLQDAGPLASRPMAAAVPGLVEPASPDPIVTSTITDAMVAVPTTGELPADSAVTLYAAEPMAPRPVSLEPRSAEPSELTRVQPIAAPELPDAPAPAPAVSAPPVAAPAPLVAAPAAPPPVRESIDDVTLVRQTLQQYRSAYDGLDAQSAQAVYPAVNQAALARAFEGLESQTLTFDACDVMLRGDAAMATCRGTAKYVPKIGSREPRTEARVWNFTLHKSGADWKIESARAER